MAFEIEKMANKLGGNGNGFEMERISEAVENGTGGSGGSDSGILFATITFDTNTMTLDKTWKQFYDAPFAIVTGVGPGSVGRMAGFVLGAFSEADTYSVVVFTGSSDNLANFTTDSEDGYPVMQI